MDGEALRVALLLLTVSTAMLWFGSSFLVRASGTWERMLSDDDRRAGERPERIELKSVGPFVSGRGEVSGGKQEYSGYIFGRTLHLKRRDHGERYLRDQGYPPAIASKRDGEEGAILKLRLIGEQLEGEFFALKVEYTHQPPRVTQVLRMAPTSRRYTRLALVRDEERVPESMEEPAGTA